MDIDKRLDELRIEMAETFARAEDMLTEARDVHQRAVLDAERMRHQAFLIEARILGIQEARDAVVPRQQSGGNGAKKPRAPRRDIRKAVADEVAALGILPQHGNPSAIAEKIGCRHSQVVAALAALAAVSE